MQILRFSFPRGIRKGLEYVVTGSQDDAKNGLCTHTLPVALTQCSQIPLYVFKKFSICIDPIH